MVELRVAKGRCAAGLCGVMLLVLGGCGSSGEGSVERARASASGKAEFDGKPIPTGAVVFIHLESGTTVSCPISNGRYANERNAAPLVGDNSVSLIGLDQVDGKQLWNGTWSKPVKVQGSKFQEDFNVLTSELKPVVSKRKSKTAEEDAEEEKPVYQQK